MPEPDRLPPSDDRLTTVVHYHTPLGNGCPVHPNDRASDVPEEVTCGNCRRLLARPEGFAMAARPKKLQCELCECELTPLGDVLRVSEKAKGFRRHEETIEDLQRKVTQLETENGELRRKVAELAPAGSSALKGLEL